MEDVVEAEGADLEIEIIDPEAVILDDGSMEITLIPDARYRGRDGVRYQPCRSLG